jgi:hypothetical protein
MITYLIAISSICFGGWTFPGLFWETITIFWILLRSSLIMDAERVSFLSTYWLCCVDLSEDLLYQY